ncbi:MAG: hypothetical protein ACKVP7_19945 [Hyphomicrobiaceae bacterium]
MATEPTAVLQPEDAKRLEAALVDLTRAVKRIQGDHQLSTPELMDLLGDLSLNWFWNPAKPTPLPPTAPELWAKRDLNRRENAPVFTRRVYSIWLGNNLTRKDISRLDPELYKALSVWLARHPDDEIARLLPTQSDQLDEAIERLADQYPLEFLRKLGYAIDTRMRRQEK